MESEPRARQSTRALPSARSRELGRSHGLDGPQGVRLGVEDELLELDGVVGVEEKVKVLDRLGEHLMEGRGRSVEGRRRAGGRSVEGQWKVSARSVGGTWQGVEG